MENKNLCEQIEIAIYSDAELSSEMQNHIENCESCKALLSQINAMKNDLGLQDFTGIKDGEIANAVMGKIRETKLASSKPKFKISHHLGTAAAIVIIFAAALMIKKPSQTDSFDKGNNENSAEVVYDDANIHYHVLSNTADTVTESNAAPAMGAESKENDESFDTSEPKLMMKSARTQSISPEAAEKEEAIAEEDIIEESTETEGAVLMFSVSNDAAGYYDTNDEEVGSLLLDGYMDDLADEVQNSGGATNEAIKYSSINEKYIFEGLDFKDGEENLEHNISLINERLSYLYGDGYVISVSKLKDMGVDNEKLLEIAPTVTDRMFTFYKNTLNIFE